MKRIIAVIAVLMLLFAAGCSGGAKDIDVVSSTETPESGSEWTSGAEKKTRVSIVGSVAYLFDGGKTLYGAVEYKNTSDCAIVLSSASFDFRIDGQETFKTFIPVLAEYDVVMPGETSYVIYWEKFDEPKPSNAKVELHPALSCEKAETQRINIALSDAMAAENYPGFATLSGVIENTGGERCSLNMIYAAFYDEYGSLLGVWNFTENAALDVGARRSFVSNMTELEIDRLADRAAVIKGAGFGFN